MKNLLIFALILLFLTACTAEMHEVKECLPSEPKGFLWGLWHGIIAPVTFVISLFTDALGVYDINNNGGWYDFGFLLGIGAFTSGANQAGKNKK